MKKNNLKLDFKIFFCISSFLTLIGLIFIYSSSSVFALEKFGSANFFLKKQLFFLIPAILGFIFFASISIKFLKKYAFLFFLFSLFLTILTFIPQLSIKVHGSNRWLNLFGFSLQPSEFLKFFLLIYIGAFLAKKEKYVKSFFNSYLPFLLILGFTFLILLKQPDFGSVVTLMVTAFTLFFIAKFNFFYLFITALCAVPAAIFLIATKSYRLQRILIFINPWSDPRGRGFQIIQSLIAIGSGSLWGVGISNSRQKFFYLPMQHTDFIFSIIAEEVGFVGVFIIVFLYFLFCLFGFRIALKLSDSFAVFTVLGFIILISLQSVVNFMVVSGLLPTKGLGLPLISYGGTALICFWCMIGLIANFVRNNS
ncbi:putative lipid II flippase FtsW [Candidatus Babeliales bacterium]|nr:putative lipid II flippase FtsW [Candidatus Babeliales bacterium]